MNTSHIATDLTETQQIVLTPKLAEQIVDQAFDALKPRFITAVATFLALAISPTAVFQFEAALLLLVRELGRLVLRGVVQSLEPVHSNSPPKDLYFQCGGYRRRAKPTPSVKV